MPTPAPRPSSSWGSDKELSAFSDDSTPDVAPVVAPAKPDAPAQGAEKPPEPKADAKPVEPAPASQTPAQAAAAAARKWKIKGKVAGAEQEWDVSEDDFDETKSPDGHKKLRDIFQKAADYDRPGGALDQAAQKRASQLQAKSMVDQGYWVLSADGKSLEWAPQFREYGEWLKTRGTQAPAANVPRGTSAAEPELTVRQKRIAELEGKIGGDGLTAKELREHSELVADERMDAREAYRAAKSDAEKRKQADDNAAKSKTQRDVEENATKGRERIAAFVAQFANKFTDPITGKVDPQEIEDAKRLMEDTAIRTQDWASAERAVTTLAERRSGYFAEVSKRLTTVRTPTAPPSAPVLRGGQSAGAGGENGNGNGKNGKFNPRRGFGDQGRVFDEYVRSAGGSE